jgi:undecaprenyl diphosphate synthase
MELLRVYLRGELAELHRDGVRLKFIGDHARLPQDVQNMISESTQLTANNTAGTLIIALSYGGRQEIVQAAQKLAQQGMPATEENFTAALDTHGIPDPDLLIRTSGEMRLSNFLLWQTAYTEFVFTETLWPDFGAKDLDAAIAEYQQRERRYGKLGALA